ncbi:MAG: ubiquinone biosynthesis regulatory protein kinase UbiB [Methylophilaceae bacterium]|nr:ubiquinone biosynthesis regulatory protein kinase UbiB [Methylophilaceae bacterium]
MRFSRLIFIILISFRYGLDEFILAHNKLKPLLKLFNLIFFWRNITKPRGERLRLALESLGPIFVKFGQMLSTRRDLIAPDIADELARLQDRVPPFAYTEVEKIVFTSFGQPITQVFSQFDAIPIASASVAQVHFAHLPDNTPVAVKVLRPNIDKIIARDLALLNTAAWLLQKISSEAKRLKPREIVEEFARHTHSELDLTLEAANCSQLHRNFSKTYSKVLPLKPLLLIPEIYWDFCRKQVMVMQRMDGTPISQVDVLRAKGINISKLAREGVEIFFTQVFRDGFFHADMHPGNIQVADDGRYIALDFGIMGSLGETDKYYLARNFLAFFNRDYRDVAIAHLEAGWVPKGTNMEELETAVRAVCEPIFDKPLKDISFGRTLLSLFQMSRRFGVIIQPQLIMLQKTLLNIEGLGRDLDPDLDLWQTARPFLSRWMSEQVGWRSVVKTLKKELPHITQLLPQIPRLVHQQLTTQIDQQQEMPLNASILELVKTQKKQNRWLKLIAVALMLVVVIQICGAVFLFL